MALKDFETWGSFEIGVGLFDLFKRMRIANKVLTRRHTVKLSTRDDAVFFLVSSDVLPSWWCERLWLRKPGKCRPPSRSGSCVRKVPETGWVCSWTTSLTCERISSPHSNELCMSEWTQAAMKATAKVIKKASCRMKIRCNLVSAWCWFPMELKIFA